MFVIEFGTVRRSVKLDVNRSPRVGHRSPCSSSRRSSRTAIGAVAASRSELPAAVNSVSNDAARRNSVRTQPGANDRALTSSTPRTPPPSTWLIARPRATKSTSLSAAPKTGTHLHYVREQRKRLGIDRRTSGSYEAGRRPRALHDRRRPPLDQFSTPNVSACS
jgi:hypothetical protein